MVAFHRISVFSNSIVASLSFVSLNSCSLKIFRLLSECAHISACPQNINKGALIHEGWGKVHTNMSVQVTCSQACRKQHNEQLSSIHRLIWSRCNDLTMGTTQGTNANDSNLRILPYCIFVPYNNLHYLIVTHSFIAYTNKSSNYTRKYKITLKTEIFENAF